MAERTLIDQAKTRLRRIEGQVRGIQGMLDRMAAEDGEAAPAEPPAEAEESEGRCGPEPCDGLLTQLLAVRAAVEQVGVIIMELHLQHCVLGDLPEDEERMRNLREALKLWTKLS
jgi:DNA-binding FrmR family transcriptional regulator